MSAPAAGPVLDVRERLAHLARIRSDGTPVVTVYLGTRWADEHQRERTRIFLKRAVAAARAGGPAASVLDDLAWIEAQGDRLVAGGGPADAGGVALFACRAVGLREMVAIRAPFDDALVLSDRPALTRLAGVAAEIAPLLVAFVDGESARLVPVGADGRGDEVTLDHDVIGRHRQGGWALLAQSRYRRHVEAHRAQHFEAVADALAGLVEEHGIERIVLAGEHRALAVFRKHLPLPVAARVVGTVAGAGYEPAAALVGRAVVLVAGVEGAARAGTLEAVLVEAAKGGRAVAGVEPTLDAVVRGAVRRLYLARGFEAPGAVCTGCDVVRAGDGEPCVHCGGAMRAVPLGDEIVGRVLADGGTVDLVDAPALAGAGGLAAQLRYPV